MVWDDESIAKLRKLWADETLSSAEIARRLGTSKNAVLGKAHRIGLPSRPSLIVRTGTQIVKKPKPEPMAKPVYVQDPAEERASKWVPEGKQCCWPIGDPKRPSFHFCGGVAEAGKPYCTAHAGLAYAKFSDWQTQNAR